MDNVDIYEINNIEIKWLSFIYKLLQSKLKLKMINFEFIILL